jgi:hypothetical protein
LARSALKLAMLGGMLGYGFLVVGSGLDRASAQQPGIARWVPRLLAAEAHRAEATLALQSNAMAEAIEPASRAVLADPINPRSTGLLGAAQLEAGQQVKADRTFRVAGRFGWREPLTQIYFMNVALNSGQPRLAALRLDAVLRQAPNLPGRDTFIAQFTGTPDRRAALAERLALHPSWTAAFIAETPGVALPELESRASILESLATPRWGCDTVAPMVARMIQLGGVASAKQLWRAHCASASAGIADPGFRQITLGRPPIAFDWNLVGSGDVSANAANPGLLVRVSGASPLPVAWQMLSLAPGRYRLSWTALSGSNPAKGAELSLTCNPTGRSRILGSPKDDRGRFEAPVTIDAACPGHFLTLWLAQGTQDVRFDDVAIVRD